IVGTTCFELLACRIQPAQIDTKLEFVFSADPAHVIAEMVCVVKLGPLGFVQNRATPPGLSKTFIAAALEPDNREGTGFPFCDALEPNLPRPTLANIWAVEVLTLLANA